MITQQVAVYLIKRMTSTAAKDTSHAAQESTDELSQYHLENRVHHRPQATIEADGTIDDHAIVYVLRWRATDPSYRAYQGRVVEETMNEHHDSATQPQTCTF